jgi:hypothetical protein
VAYETFRARRAGLGFLPLVAAAVPTLVSSVTGSSSAKKAAKAAQELEEARIAAELKMHKRDLQAEAASGRQDSAADERNRVVKYALWGLGGLAALGGVVLFIASRRKNPPRRRRRRR